VARPVSTLAPHGRGLGAGGGLRPALGSYVGVRVRGVFSGVLWAGEGAHGIVEGEAQDLDEEEAYSLRTGRERRRHEPPVTLTVTARAVGQPRGTNWKRCGRRGVNLTTARRTENRSNQDIRWMRVVPCAVRGRLVADKSVSIARTGSSQSTLMDTDNPLPHLGCGLTEPADRPRQTRSHARCLSTGSSLPFRTADSDCRRFRTRLLPVRGHGRCDGSDSPGPRLFRGLPAFTDWLFPRLLMVVVARTLRALRATTSRTEKPTGW
jgi:hypothetical protein